ncbi:MAG: ATP synthase subunit I [Desulfocapsaceae bacterium]|nr:ATP synthase subunit I [Desulfocapsaceae bacterium]
MINNLMSLRKMQVLSWVYLVILTALSWLVVSWSFAWAVLVGGIISIVSFMVAHKDVIGFIESLTPIQGEECDKKQIKKKRAGFIIKFWFRILIIGIALGLLMWSQKINRDNIIGLILGLSTVVFTVTITALGVVRHYLFSGRR